MVGGDEWGAVGVASHKRVMIDQSRFRANLTSATFHSLCDYQMTPRILQFRPKHDLKFRFYRTVKNDYA